MTDARRDFSTGRFWTTLRRGFRRIGREGIEKALWLYYAAQDPDLPAEVRAKIYGALAYLLLPVDAVPDLLPGGYVEDLGMLAWVLVSVAVHITPEVKRRAADKIRAWFDE